MIDKLASSEANLRLLAPNELTKDFLQHTLSQVIASGAESADLYLAYCENESWMLEEEIVKKAGFSVTQGFGIRAILGEEVGFAYADDCAKSSISHAALAAAKIAKLGTSKEVTPLLIANRPIAAKATHNLYSKINPLLSLTDSAKVALLKKIDSQARNKDSRVVQVNATLSSSYQVIIIIDTEGTWQTDIRPLTNLSVTVLLDTGTKKESGSCGGGSRAGCNIFIDESLADFYVNEAIRIATISLDAKPAPAGMFPVVLGNGWPAVMIHEAVGHGLEADFNRKQHSIYSNRIGQVVASPQVSIVDQGNLPGKRRGSLNIDDEGTPTQETMLIENGVLRSYLFDKLNAKLMKTKSTGNGRRASYAVPTIPRMTNTFMLNGTYDPKEIIASVDRGVYALNFSGGQVDITSGEFVFTTSEAYLIEQGKITAPIKEATLIGNGPEVLQQVSMVGNDLKLDYGVGVCGKQGQNVPVGIGQPTLKIAKLTVGGTKLES